LDFKVLLKPTAVPTLKYQNPLAIARSDYSNFESDTLVVLYRYFRNT